MILAWPFPIIILRKCDDVLFTKEKTAKIIVRLQANIFFVDISAFILFTDNEYPEFSYFPLNQVCHPAGSLVNILNKILHKLTISFSKNYDFDLCRTYALMFLDVRLLKAL